MSLRESEGNMYDFVSHTFNGIKGRCPHDCEYCYMKQFPQNEVRLDEKALKLDLGTDNFIFVGSSCDMFAEDIPIEWIKKVLDYCSTFKNKYLFQSKNPERMYKMLKDFTRPIVFGTTIETNRLYKQLGKTPSVMERAKWMRLLNEMGETMITIEPIMDFDTEELTAIMKEAKPTWINIGADSKGHNLPEPSKEKILELVAELEKFTEIRKKHNMERILG